MTEGSSFALNRMTDSLPGRGEFVMRRLQTVGLTGIDFVHHKFFDFVHFDSDTFIPKQRVAMEMNLFQMKKLPIEGDLMVMQGK